MGRVLPAGSAPASPVRTARFPSFASLSKFRSLVDGIGVADGALFVLLAATLWLPPLLGNRAWPPALGFVVVVAGYTVVRQQRRPPIPAALAVYVAVCVLAAAHGGGSVRDIWRYFAGPVTAVAFATILVIPAQRVRALVLIVFFSLTQIPVALGQTIRAVVVYGRHGAAADRVTGALGANHAGIVTLVTLAAACLVLAGWLFGAIGSAAAAITLAGLVAVGTLTATRVAFVFLVVAGATVVLATIALREEGRPSGHTCAVACLALLALSGGVYGVTRAIYPDAFVGALSSQNLSTIGVRQSDLPPTGALAPASTFTVPVLLPGRLSQLRLALRLSVESGVAIGALGRGLGSAEPDAPRYPSASAIPPPQRTATTWLGKILTETGWLGVGAFFGFLGWLVLLGCRVARRPGAERFDRVLGAALPGIAVLTAAGAAYATVLSVRGYATVFWVLVGVAISAASSPTTLGRTVDTRVPR
jgi:hypothetical protein